MKLSKERWVEKFMSTMVKGKRKLLTERAGHAYASIRNGAGGDNGYRAEIEKLQKIIGKQAIQADASPLGEAE